MAEEMTKEPFSAWIVEHGQPILRPWRGRSPSKCGFSGYDIFTYTPVACLTGEWPRDPSEQIKVIAGWFTELEQYYVALHCEHNFEDISRIDLFVPDFIILPQIKCSFAKELPDLSCPLHVFRKQIDEEWSSFIEMDVHRRCPGSLPQAIA